MTEYTIKSNEVTSVAAAVADNKIALLEWIVVPDLAAEVRIKGARQFRVPTELRPPPRWGLND